MNKVQQEIEAMQACWTHLRTLPPESRNAVVLWLFDHVDDEVEGYDPNGWRVHMSSFGERKINVIKILRAYRELGLRDAKELVESAPCDVATGLVYAAALDLAEALREVGAEVVLR